MSTPAVITAPRDAPPDLPRALSPPNDTPVLRGIDNSSNCTGATSPGAASGVIGGKTESASAAAAGAATTGLRPPAPSFLKLSTPVRNGFSPTRRAHVLGATNNVAASGMNSHDSAVASADQVSKAAMLHQKPPLPQFQQQQQQQQQLSQQQQDEQSETEQKQQLRRSRADSAAFAVEPAQYGVPTPASGSVGGVASAHSHYTFTGYSQTKLTQFVVSPDAPLVTAPPRLPPPLPPQSLRNANSFNSHISIGDNGSVPFDAVLDSSPAHAAHGHAAHSHSQVAISIPPDAATATAGAGSSHSNSDNGNNNTCKCNGRCKTIAARAPTQLTNYTSNNHNNSNNSGGAANGGLVGGSLGGLGVVRDWDCECDCDGCVEGGRSLSGNATWSSWVLSFFLCCGRRPLLRSAALDAYDDGAGKSFNQCGSNAENSNSREDNTPTVRPSGAKKLVSDSTNANADGVSIDDCSESKSNRVLAPAAAALSLKNFIEEEEDGAIAATAATKAAASSATCKCVTEGSGTECKCERECKDEDSIGVSARRGLKAAVLQVKSFFSRANSSGASDGGVSGDQKTAVATDTTANASSHCNGQSQSTTTAATPPATEVDNNSASAAGVSADCEQPIKGRVRSLSATVSTWARGAFSSSKTAAAKSGATPNVDDAVTATDGSKSSAVAVSGSGV